MSEPLKATPLWTVKLPKERRVRARAPVFASDALYQVFHYDKGSFFESVLIALDASTGTERWRATISHVANEPVVGPDGTIYLSSFEGSVLAYDRDGRQLWTSPDARQNLGVPCLAGNGRLVVAEIGQGRRTWCLDPHSGAVLWAFDSGGFTYPVAATGDTIVHATVVDGAKFGESTPHLFVLSAEDGRVRWSAKHDQYMFMPAIIGDLVVAGARGGLLAYRLGDGKPAARLRLPPDAAVKILVRVADGLLIADDAGAIRRIALEEKRSFLRSTVGLTERWTASFAEEPLGRPVPLGEAVATLDGAGDLHLLGIEDGRRLALHRRNGDVAGAGGIACSSELLAVANGRNLEAYRRSDLVG